MIRKPMFAFSRKVTSKQIYKSLKKDEKEKVNSFKDYILISASLTRADEGVRELLRFRKVTGANLNEVGLEDLRYFLKELKMFEFGDHTKNKIKDFVQKFLRWGFKDWSERFDEFNDIKLNTDAQRKKPITSKEIIHKEDFEKLMKKEPSLFWKSFLSVSWFGALRTGEARSLSWDRVKFEDDDYTVLDVKCKKNRNGTIKIRTIPLPPEATFFLKELKEQQRISEIQSKWVFPSPKNKNKHISKSANLWFTLLTKRVLGVPYNNYLLRHGFGTSLKLLVKEGKMGKDNAVEFMGHSEKMFDKVYSHLDKEDVKELMKKQIYNFEYVAPEKKNELEKEMDKIKKILAVVIKERLGKTKTKEIEVDGVKMIQDLEMTEIMNK